MSELTITIMNEYLSMTQVARAIGIPCLGRNKIYQILKKLEIVDVSNRPQQKYIDAGLLKQPDAYKLTGRKGALFNVTLAVGAEGLDFIRNTVLDYLKTDDIPCFPHHKRIVNGTDI